MQPRDSSVLDASEFAPRTDAALLDHPGHVVQFYESDSFLVDTVARFIGAGLGAGDALVVICTGPHREQLELQLLSWGMDLVQARAEARYVTLDADETLSRFMVGGEPDATLFDDVVGGVIARATGRRHARVRAFGEMVALLWAAGKRESAIRLEELWNGLARKYSFSLLCAYPIRGFEHFSDAAPFSRVCRSHSHVIPAESYPAVATDEERLRDVARLQQKAIVLEGAALDRERLTALVQSSDDAIVSKTLDGIVTSWNPGAERIFGFTAEEMIGQPVSRLIPPERRDEFPGILETIRRGERVDHFECERIRKDGRRICISLTVSPIRDMQGRIIGASKIARDVTERKQAEAERERLLREAERARAEAEAANRAKDHFLSVVSHELRTPLASILGWVAVLQSGAAGEKAARALETIERNGRAQAKLIDDLLDASRMIAGRLQLDLRLADLPDVVRKAIDTIRPTADAKGVPIEARLDPSAGPVAGDPDRLQQIVSNLLSNAVKFTPAGGLVEIRLDRQAQDVELVVRDTGRGISRDFLPFIFERFRQAESAQVRRNAGLGLGLAIVRHLVELHGGSVAAASEGDGCGATFTVKIPLLPKLFDADATNGARRLLLDGLRVLVVDDNFDGQDSLRAILEAHGARVTVAGSVPEARDVLRESPPDVLISDIRLPGEDGYALVRELRATDGLRFVPAIAVTGHANEESKGRAAKAGYQVHFGKPVEPELLLAAVARLTGQPNLVRRS